MVAPLVYYARTHANGSNFQHYVRGYRQSPPFNIPTPVYIERNFGSGTDGRSWNWGPGDLGITTWNKGEKQAINKAIERFDNQLGDQSSFGATLTAERKETFAMLTSTVLRLARAARAIRKLNFGDAAKELGLPYSERTVKERVYVTRNGKRRPKTVRKQAFQYGTGREWEKTLANGWLMYSYGVKPLVQDLDNGLDVLRRPILYKEKIKGSAKFSDKFSESFGGPGTGYYYTLSGRKIEVVVNVSAHVSVANPDLYLMHQLGLTNPLQWLNEAIPFSFVADWFSNLSQVIGNVSRWAGLSVTDQSIGMRHNMEETFFTVGYEDVVTKWTKGRFIYQRSNSIPFPSFVVAYERPSVQRALNAISLLVGFLPRKG
jgi:hypothetical protein